MMEQDNPKIGFKWKLIYRGIAGFAWELVPDPDAVGTVAKPFEWFAGIRVAMGYHYTNGVDVALAVADGIPATFEDISIHAAREGGDA